MNSRALRSNTRPRRREQQVAGVNEQAPTPMVAEIVSGPPMIDLDDIEDDDVIESTASAFAQAKSKSRTRRGPLIVDVESGDTTRLSKNCKRLRSDQANVECDESNKSRKAKTVAPEEEPKFNCPICLCPFTGETSTRCGHIFCNSCIKNAISQKAKCPTCRKNVKAKDLIRVFLPTTK